MKKVLSKITHRDHHAGTTDDHDDFAHVRDHDRDPDDEVLQASLYVDAEPRAPPRVGELPIRGNVMSEPPSSQLPRPRRSSTSATDAEMATGLGQRQRTARGDDDRVDQRHDGDHYPLPPPERGMPTNFSRRTIAPARTRGASMTERKLPPTPNSAAAIQPQDLASPEFSYLSKVYGKRTDASVLPVEKDPPTRQPAVATRGTTPSSRGASPPAQSGPVVGSPPPRTHALPAGPPVPEHHHSLPREPAIPRKQVGSGPPSSIQSPGNHEVTDGRSASGYPLLDEGSSVSSGGDPQMPRVEQPPSSAYPSMATQHATGTSSQENVVYVGHSSDTEVITKQAPAVIHETVVPKVHHITEERIQREIHTYEVIHRIQPVIDVQVLPPRHFVPDGNGGLREVSADEIPGRLGHWGIVETVTKERPGETFLPLGPSEPQIISQRSYVTEDGIRRTETTWKHPPRLETRARDAGETWPLAICPEAFAEKHGALRIAAPPNERVTSAFTSDAAARATATPSDLPDNRSPPHGVEIMGTGRSRDANVVTPPASKPTPALAPRDTPSVESDGPKGTPSVAPAYMSPPASGPLHRSSPGPQEPRSPRRDLDGSKKPLPGAFPSVSSDSTTTMSTFAEQQER